MLMQILNKIDIALSAETEFCECSAIIWSRISAGAVVRTIYLHEHNSYPFDLFVENFPKYFAFIKSVPENIPI